MQSYNPEMQTYMELNGFIRIDRDIDPESMIFKKGDTAVLMFNGTMEYRQYRNPMEWRMIKRWIGFDGQDMFQFMMMLHFMDAVKISDVHRQLLRDEFKNDDDNLVLYGRSQS